MAEKKVTRSELARAYNKWRKVNPDAYYCLIRVREDMAGNLVADEDFCAQFEAQECPLGRPKQVIYQVSGDKQVVIELVKDEQLGDKGYRIYIWHKPRASRRPPLSVGA